MHDRLCLSVSSFHEDFVNGRVDVFTFLDVAHEMDFHWVELCDRSISSYKPQDLHDLSYECEKRNIKIACIDVRNDFAVDGDENFEKQAIHVLKWINIAKQLHVRMVRVWAGGQAVTDNYAFRRICKAFRMILPTAKKCEIYLALENHGGLTCDADKVIQILDYVGSPFLRACPDFGWFDKENHLSSLNKVFPYAIHVHAKSYRFDDHGHEVDIDYPAIGSIVKAYSYRGLFSVEYEGESLDRKKGIRQTVALIERFLINDNFVPDNSPQVKFETFSLEKVAPPEKAFPPYVCRIQTENLWHYARSMVLPYVELLASKPETIGVVLLGGIADREHRRFIDEYSDLDLALFISIPQAQGYVCPKAFARDYPELLPLWLPNFQFNLPVDGQVLEVNCHQLILEVEENSNFHWNFSKMEAYHYTGEIRYDPTGRIANLIQKKCEMPTTVERLIVLASQLPWYGWINPIRQIKRGSPISAKILINHAIEILLEILFLSNDRLAPYLKWQFEMCCDLPWKPEGFRLRMLKILEENDIIRSIELLRDLSEEILQHLKKDGQIPEDPFRYTSIYLDPDRQLRSITAADNFFDVVSEFYKLSLKNNTYDAVNYNLISIAELPLIRQYPDSSEG